MLTAADRIGIPVLLLSELWGVFSVVLDVFKKLHERRERFLILKSGKIDDYGSLTANTVLE